jgi:hypothetical protein
MLKADGFDDAIIGIGYQCHNKFVVYDYDKCVKILMKRDKMKLEDAVEFMEYNVVGAWMGEGTPIFLEKGNLDDLLD